MAAKQTKTVDRQKVLAKLTKQLKKEFGGLPRKREPLPVLETMLFATCLEDATPDAAKAAFDRLDTDFFDRNEVRVSTITELEPTFEGLPDPARRAMRVRSLLYYVFDHHFSYDFDGIKKKPMELVQKQLSKIKHLTPFARHYLLQNSLSSHTIPLDERMLKLAVYLGLVPRRATVDTAPELLKAMIKKSDGLEFAWVLKAASVSSKADVLMQMDDVSDGADLADAESRLSDLLAGRLKRRVQAATRKAEAEAKAAAKKAAAKKAAAKRKAAAKKKTAAKKASTKTAAKKKKTAAKAAKKKKTAAKTATKKTTRKKAAKKKKTAGRKK